MANGDWVRYLWPDKIYQTSSGYKPATPQTWSSQSQCRSKPERCGMHRLANFVQRKQLIAITSGIAVSSAAMFQSVGRTVARTALRTIFKVGTELKSDLRRNCHGSLGQLSWGVGSNISVLVPKLIQNTFTTACTIILKFFCLFFYYLDCIQSRLLRIKLEFCSIK